MNTYAIAVNVFFQAALSNQLNSGANPQIDARTMESAGHLYNKLREVINFVASLCSPCYCLSSLRLVFATELSFRNLP